MSAAPLCLPGPLQEQQCMFIWHQLLASGVVKAELDTPRSFNSHAVPMETKKGTECYKGLRAEPGRTCLPGITAEASRQGIVLLLRNIETLGMVESE